jgi:hypothetical protein
LASNTPFSGSTGRASSQVTRCNRSGTRAASVRRCRSRRSPLMSSSRYRSGGSSRSASRGQASARSRRQLPGLLRHRAPARAGETREARAKMGPSSGVRSRPPLNFGPALCNRDPAEGWYPCSQQNSEAAVRCCHRSDLHCGRAPPPAPADQPVCIVV